MFYKEKLHGLSCSTGWFPEKLDRTRSLGSGYDSGRNEKRQIVTQQRGISIQAG
jgi:hypothetical protein